MINSFSNIPNKSMVQYSTISVGDFTEVIIYSQGRVLYKSTWSSG